MIRHSQPEAETDRIEEGNEREDEERKHQTTFLQFNYYYVDLTDRNSVSIYKKTKRKK